MIHANLDFKRSVKPHSDFASACLLSGLSIGCSVDFEDVNGNEITIAGLSSPFVVTIDLGASGGRSTNDSAFCSHWDTRAKLWVSDGWLINQTEDTIICGFNHLTSFGALLDSSTFVFVAGAINAWRFLPTVDIVAAALDRWTIWTFK